jgi:hypothetical protein
VGEDWSFGIGFQIDGARDEDFCFLQKRGIREDK